MTTCSRCGVCGRCSNIWTTKRTEGMSDQARFSPYVLHGFYYLKDRDSGPDVCRTKDSTYPSAGSLCHQNPIPFARSIPCDMFSIVAVPFDLGDQGNRANISDQDHTPRVYCMTSKTGIAGLQPDLGLPLLVPIGHVPNQVLDGEVVEAAPAPVGWCLASGGMPWGTACMSSQHVSTPPEPHRHARAGVCGATGKNTTAATATAADPRTTAVCHIHAYPIS